MARSTAFSRGLDWGEAIGQSRAAEKSQRVFILVLRFECISLSAFWFGAGTECPLFLSFLLSFRSSTVNNFELLEEMDEKIEMARPSVALQGSATRSRRRKPLANDATCSL